MSSDILYGINSLDALLQKQPHRVKQIYLLKGKLPQRVQQIIEYARKQGISCTFHDKKYFEKHYANKNTQGVVAEIVKAKSLQEADILDIVNNSASPPFILILDGVTDPHNLGAVLRSADAAGVDLVIAPKDRAVAITDVVRKVASGAADLIPFVQVTNLARVMKELQQAGVWIYGFSDKASDDYFNVDFTGAIALVLGAEGKGMRRLTAEHCDGLLQIPMAGVVSSLNVSVAAGVSLFEVVRQRKKK